MDNPGMMYFPLSVPSILAQSSRNFPEGTVISKDHDGSFVSYRYPELETRSKQLASALIELGVEPSHRVATMAWNTHRHVEAYYAIAGVGAVVHTVNPRLFDDQIVYILNHAEDRVLLIDSGFADLLVRIGHRLETLDTVIVMGPEEELPPPLLQPVAVGDRTWNFFSYEPLIRSQPAISQWLEADEQAPVCLCYTSGTTGNPKGVLYSHRSTVLHAMASCMPNALGLSEDTRVMPVVPMYHVSAWGLPYSGIMSGATLVLPGDGMDGESLYRVIDFARPNLLLGVPTVWFNLLDYLRQNGKSMPSVKTVAVGGAAAPRALVEALENEHGIYLMPLWGMTETSPLATFGVRNNFIDQLDKNSRHRYQTSAGRNIWGIELKLEDDGGNTLPHDGIHYGNLLVRGHWVIDTYFKAPESAAENGWFNTGDVATIDDKGYLRIVDRNKDVIKSGGEWISSIQMENAALEHPSVKEACVVGVPHEKWDERPILFVVVNAECELDIDGIRNFLAERVAKWWLPDDVIAVGELPHTATGKLQKNKLREAYKDHLAGNGDV